MLRSYVEQEKQRKETTAVTRATIVLHKKQSQKSQWYITKILFSLQALELAALGWAQPILTGLTHVYAGWLEAVLWAGLDKVSVSAAALSTCQTF